MNQHEPAEKLARQMWRARFGGRSRPWAEVDEDVKLRMIGLAEDALLLAATEEPDGRFRYGLFGVLAGLILGGGAVLLHALAYGGLFGCFS